jgi:3-methylcrotonyl-CoA carboxylase alpha subunit
VLTGLTTNVSFLNNIINQQAFQNGQLTTHYLTHNPITSTSMPIQSALYAATFKQLSHHKVPLSPWQHQDAWQANLPSDQPYEFCFANELLQLTLSQPQQNHFKSNVKNYSQFRALLQDNDTLIIQTDTTFEKFRVFFNDDDHTFDVFTPSAHHTLSIPAANYDSQAQSEGSLNAPMPGMVIAISCHQGTSVRKDQVLMIIEAMKMEHPIKAPFDGVIDEIFYQLGEQVNEGEPLLAIQEIKGNA